MSETLVDSWLAFPAGHYSWLSEGYGTRGQSESRVSPVLWTPGCTHSSGFSPWLELSLLLSSRNLTLLLFLLPRVSWTWTGPAWAVGNRKGESIYHSTMGKCGETVSMVNCLDRLLSFSDKMRHTCGKTKNQETIFLLF